MKTKNEGQNLIFEEGDVFTAQKYLRNLASGRSPLDGADLAEAHLLRERERAYRAELSPDCRKQCSACGAAKMLHGRKCDE